MGADGRLGLATTHHLGKEHGITNVAVLERGWIGGGNVGRHTTIVRSNYMLPGNEPFYEFSMKLWESLEVGHCDAAASGVRVGMLQTGQLWALEATDEYIETTLDPEGASADVIDQSSGWVAPCLTDESDGRAVRGALARICKLALEAFPDSGMTRTPMEHLGAMILSRGRRLHPPFRALLRIEPARHRWIICANDLGSVIRRARNTGTGASGAADGQPIRDVIRRGAGLLP